MWSEPAMRDPVKGLVVPNSARIAIKPGISCSASVISARPKSARERSATLKSNVAEVMVLLGVSDFQAPTSVAHAWKYRIASDADAELHDVAVAHDVLLALDTGFARRLDLRHGAERHEVLEGDHFSFDEVLLEVGVNLAGRFGGRGPLVDRPRPRFLGTGGKEGLQAQRRESDPREQCQAGLVLAVGLEKFERLGFFEVRQLRLDFRTQDDRGRRCDRRRKRRLSRRIAQGLLVDVEDVDEWLVSQEVDVSEHVAIEVPHLGDDETLIERVVGFLDLRQTRLHLSATAFGFAFDQGLVIS